MFKISDYEAVAGAEAIDEIRFLADRLAGKSVQHINSTAVGGGVAEILSRMLRAPAFEEEKLSLAKALKVSLRPKRFRKLPTEAPVDDSHPAIVLNPNRCILCGKCVWVCNQAGESGVLDFVFRGLRTRVAPFHLEPLAESACDDCMRCVDVCPVGALTRKQAPSESSFVAPSTEDQQESA